MNLNPVIVISIEELKQKEIELSSKKDEQKTAEDDVKLHANNLSGMETLMSKKTSSAWFRPLSSKGRDSS